MRQAVWCWSVDFQAAPPPKVPLQGGTGFFQSGAGVVPTRQCPVGDCCRRGAVPSVGSSRFGLDRFQPRRALGPRQHGITEPPELPLASVRCCCIQNRRLQHIPINNTPRFVAANPPQPSICDCALTRRRFSASFSEFPNFTPGHSAALLVVVMVRQPNTTPSPRLGRCAPLLLAC